MSDIDKLRDKINDVDQQLVNLLAVPNFQIVKVLELSKVKN